LLRSIDPDQGARAARTDNAPHRSIHAEGIMVYTAASFIARAEECVRLAALARDDLVRHELLRLRESYLQTAERLERLLPTAPKKMPRCG
jgi:hypothetical protein